MHCRESSSFSVAVLELLRSLKMPMETAGCDNRYVFHVSIVVFIVFMLLFADL